MFLSVVINEINIAIFYIYILRHMLSIIVLNF